MAGKDKNNRIKAEEKRIFSLLEGCSERELEHVSKQVQQLAWYNISIRDLQIAIDKAGTIVPYNNGASQYGERKNPDIDILIGYQKLAISLAEKIGKYVSDSSPIGDKLAEFL